MSSFAALASLITQVVSSPFATKDAIWRDGDWHISPGTDHRRALDISLGFPLRHLGISTPLTILACADGDKPEPWLTLFTDSSGRIFLQIFRGWYEAIFVVCGQSSDEVLRMMQENPTACLEEKKLWVKEMGRSGPFDYDSAPVGWQALNTQGMIGHNVGWLSTKALEFKRETQNLYKACKPLGSLVTLSTKSDVGRVAHPRLGPRPWRRRPWEVDPDAKDN